MAISIVEYSGVDGGGNCSSAIGWIDFTNQSVINNTEVPVTNTIPGGYTITFNASTEGSAVVNANTVPLTDNAAFGRTGYRGLESLVGLLSSGATVVLNLNDITVTNTNGEVINNYSIVVANAETTNTTEIWKAETDGSAWKLLDILPSIDGSGQGPSITGLNSLIVTEVGQDDVGPTNAPIIQTNSPKNLTLTFTTPGNEGLAIGILINQTVSCNLDAEIVTDNKMIYVCPGSPQYFKASVSRCCGGTAVINYCGENFDTTTGRITGNLGEYQVVGSGLIFYPNDVLIEGTMDMLVFTVSDGCNTSEITVAAVYSRCHSNCMNCTR